MTFADLLQRMQAIHTAKDNDYAGHVPYGNFRHCEAIGIPAWKGAAIRLMDKYHRFETLASGEQQQVKDESLEDTLLDLANYALIVLLLRTEARQ